MATYDFCLVVVVVVVSSQYVYMYVFDARDQQTGPSHALACPARSYVSVVSKKKREREREKHMNNQSTLLSSSSFSPGRHPYSQPVSQQSNCILLLNIPLLFSFSPVDMTIGTKSRENTHKYREHDGR
jgi:hypothetical protein